MHMYALFHVADLMLWRKQIYYCFTFSACHRLCYRSVGGTMCNFPHMLWYWEKTPLAGADLDSPPVWNSVQPLQHLLSTCAAESCTLHLQPWTDQCQLVWQETERINQFDSPRSLWFADRLSDLCFYGAEFLQNQKKILTPFYNYIISLSWIFIYNASQLFYCWIFFIKFL